MDENPWDALVSPRVGVVTQLVPQQRGAEEPVPPFLYTATLAHFDFRAADRAERINAGKGRTEREAKLSALGEAVERYSAYQWDARRTYVASAAQAHHRTITPTECVLYAPFQYAQANWPYQAYDPGTAITWIDGVELGQRSPSVSDVSSGDELTEESVTEGVPVSLPASLVYLVHPLPRLEDLFTAVTSNGLAAGDSLASAILGGLYELIERDALMITWMNRLPAVEIRLPDSGFEAASVVRHYRKFGMELRAFRLHSDQAPTVIMAVGQESDPNRPARVIGMGCDMRPTVALDKAIFELCQARPSEAMRFREKPPAGRLRCYQDVVKLDDHPAFHGLRENMHEFEFLWSTGQSIELSAMDRAWNEAGLAARLSACASRLCATGHRVAYAELTSPDVAEVGYRVVRTLATGMHPIHFGWGEARLGGQRLFEAAKLWGLRSEVTRVEELNLCPHPLA